MNFIPIAILFLQAADTQPVSAVAGTTRAAEDGHRLPGVVIMVGAGRWAVSDSSGQYSIGDLPPGPNRIRFARAGRVSLELTALLRPGRVVRLDVELGASVVRLEPVMVTAKPNHQTPRPDDVAAIRLDAQWAQSTIPGPAEVQNVLSTLPGAATRGDGTGNLNFQGGESDQAGIQIDGFPILGATHFGSSLSAVNPDLVRGIEVRMGAPPARFGGWLSGTVLLESSLLTADSEHFRGGANPTDVRQLVRGAILGGRGRFLFSGRRSFRTLWSDPAIAESGNGYEDWLGSAAVPLGGGRLQILAIESRNQLAFPSQLAAEVANGSNQLPSPSVGNNLEWRTGTVGGAWQGELPHRGTLRFRLWRATAGSAVDWRSTGAGLALDSRFTESGFRADGTLPLADGSLEFGLGLIGHRSRYQSGPFGAAPSLSVVSSSTLMTGYLERQWGIGSTLSARTGVRVNVALPGWAGLEPRVGIEFHPTEGVNAALDVGRIYQFSQSLRNQESFLSSVIAFDLPAGVGTAGLPVASADNVSLTLDASPAPFLVLGFRGYLRRFKGLLLPAASTAQPFVTGTAGVGSGTASGAEIRLTRARGLIRFDAAVAVGSAQRRLATGVRYRPGFLRTRNFSSQLGMALDSLTTIGFAFFAGNGQPTTLVGAVGWKPYDPIGGGELLGTPDNLDPGINQRRLSGVVRLDVGISRRFTLPQWMSRGQLTTSLAVENLLNHRNPLALSASGATGVPQTLFARPRTLRLEVGWRF